MRIEHVALWTQDLDRLKGFYETYFGAVANDLYRSRILRSLPYPHLHPYSVPVAGRRIT
jgi:catechol 2,3-dioxygenase-like lactoylglutathione lyase family enzyme